MKIIYNKGIPVRDGFSIIHKRWVYGGSNVVS